MKRAFYQIIRLIIFISFCLNLFVYNFPANMVVYAQDGAKYQLNDMIKALSQYGYVANYAYEDYENNGQFGMYAVITESETDMHVKGLYYINNAGLITKSDNGGYILDTFEGSNLVEYKGITYYSLYYSENRNIASWEFLILYGVKNNIPYILKIRYSEPINEKIDNLWIESARQQVTDHYNKFSNVNGEFVCFQNEDTMDDNYLYFVLRLSRYYSDEEFQVFSDMSATPSANVFQSLITIEKISGKVTDDNNNVWYLKDHINENKDTYVATWLNGNGNAIYSQEYHVGEHPSYDEKFMGKPYNSSGSNFVGWAKSPASEESVSISEFLTTDNSYSGYSGNIKYYPIFSDNLVTVSWYNGYSILDEELYKVGEYPQYKGTIPLGYDYEYGLKREFRGWTTTNNSEYDISSPENMSPVFSDTVYYAVFSDDDPQLGVDVEDIEKYNYINQHIESANTRLWDIADLSLQNKNLFESSPVSIANGVWAGTEVTVDIINIDISGLVKKVSANDYNAIMLDMFMSVENMELSEDIFLQAQLNSVKEANTFLKQACSMPGLAIKDQKSILDDIDYAYSEFLRSFDERDPNGFENYSEKINEVIKKYDLKDVKLGNMDKALKSLHAYNEINTIIGDFSTSFSTIKSYTENMSQIVAAQAYIYMDDFYKDILIEMYHEAENYEGNSWEITDLKNAIVYSLNYNENYKRTAIISMINNTSTTFVDLILGTSIMDKEGGLKKESVNDRLKSFITKRGTNYINDTFGKNISSDTVSTYLSGLQVGSKLGMYISDELFDLSNSHDMYVKIKEYGVLEDIMKKVIDKKATYLLNATTIDDQYTAALAYDKAYKMYFAIESMGADNIANYEGALAESAIKLILSESPMENIKYLSDDNTTIYDIIQKDDNFFNQSVIRHSNNWSDYKMYSEKILNFVCHSSDRLNPADYVDVMIKYNLLRDNCKVSIISCPVEVCVYSGSGQLVGKISANNIENITENDAYMYRIESTDSNVIVTPEDYTIEIIGLDEGLMSVIGGYYSDGVLVNASSENDIPIYTDYKAYFSIDKTDMKLTDKKGNEMDSYIPLSINAYVFYIYVGAFCISLIISMVSLFIFKVKRK